MLKIREAQFEDYYDIQNVCLRSGLGNNLEPTEERYKQWKSMWVNNPFYTMFQDSPIGWVLVDDVKGIVGTLSSHFSVYEINGTVMKASSASAWAVDPEFRGGSPLMLLHAFVKQSNIDILINTTPTLNAAQLFRTFGFEAKQDINHNKLFIWVTDSKSIIERVLRKKAIRLPGFTIDIASKTITSFLSLTGHVREKNNSANIKILDCFDERFDYFNSLLNKQKNILLARRDRASLEHHFALSLQSGTLTIIISEKDTKINGYILLMRTDHASINIKVQSVVDFQVLDSDDKTADELIKAALFVTHEKKCNLLEMVGFNEIKRKVAKLYHPFSRQLPGGKFFFKFNKSFKSKVNDYVLEVSKFDGDASLDTGIIIE